MSVRLSAPESGAGPDYHGEQDENGIDRLLIRENLRLTPGGEKPAPPGGIALSDRARIEVARPYRRSRAAR